jgi:hypothetical protein
VRPSRKRIQNSKQIYTSVYFNLYIFGKQMGRENIMAGMVAGIL